MKILFAMNISDLHVVFYITSKSEISAKKTVALITWNLHINKRIQAKKEDMPKHRKCQMIRLDTLSKESTQETA